MAAEAGAKGAGLSLLGETVWELEPPKLKVGGKALDEGSLATVNIGGDGLSAFDLSPSGLFVGPEAANKGADVLFSFGAATPKMGFSYSFVESAFGWN